MEAPQQFCFIFGGFSNQLWIGGHSVYKQPTGEKVITFNVISRVFQISGPATSGTAFAIDHHDKQYLITARHVIEGVYFPSTIEIYHEQQWKNIDANLVGSGSGDLDIAVLSCSVGLAPPFSLVASADGISHGQPLYFLGFPFGWRWETQVLSDHNFPTPFIKAGILSGASNDFSFLFVDGHGNKGFSGGPVVFQPDVRSNEFRVAGVVARLPTTPFNPVVNEDGIIIANENKVPLGYVQENPGFVVAVSIHHAIALIEANPIGFPLTHYRPL